MPKGKTKAEMTPEEWEIHKTKLVAAVKAWRHKKRQEKLDRHKLAFKLLDLYNAGKIEVNAEELLD